MKLVKTTCKICHREAVAQFDDDAIPEAVDKWFPMVTCNRCYDLRTKRNNAEETISRLCWTYETSPHKGKIIAAVRQTLVEATRAYAEALQGILNAPEVIWSEDFADALLQKPSECPRILWEYRAEVRKSGKNRRLTSAEQQG